MDTGPIDGEVVVLLHGFPQRASCWDEVMPRLNKKGYRTIAFDQRGYSEKARPRGRKAYKVANLASDVIALIDKIGVKSVHLVGHDWGSFVGYTVAGYYPERVRTYTSISLPHPKAFARSLFSSKQALHSWYMLFFQLPKLAEIMLINLKGVRNKQLRDSGMDAAMIKRYEREMVKEDALPGGIAWYRAFPFFGHAPNIKVPTTHIWSTADNSLERKGAELCEKYVDAPYKLIIIENGTHWLPDQKPDEVVAGIVDRIQSVN